MNIRHRDKINTPQSRQNGLFSQARKVVVHHPGNVSSFRASTKPFAVSKKFQEVGKFYDWRAAGEHFTKVLNAKKEEVFEMLNAIQRFGLVVHPEGKQFRGITTHMGGNFPLVSELYHRVYQQWLGNEAIKPFETHEAINTYSRAKEVLAAQDIEILIGGEADLGSLTPKNSFLHRIVSHRKSAEPRVAKSLLPQTGFALQTLLEVLEMLPKNFLIDNHVKSIYFYRRNLESTEYRGFYQPHKRRFGFTELYTSVNQRLTVEALTAAIGEAVYIKNKTEHPYLDRALKLFRNFEAFNADEPIIFGRIFRMYLACAGNTALALEKFKFSEAQRSDTLGIEPVTAEKAEHLFSIMFQFIKYHVLNGHTLVLKDE